MPTAPLPACLTPRCPGRGVHRGYCERHRRTTTQRGYGVRHQQARVGLWSTLPAPCGYCGVTIRDGETWVAAHRIDGAPSAGWMVAHGPCNERAKGDGGSKLGRTAPLDDPRAHFQPSPKRIDAAGRS